MPDLKWVVGIDPGFSGAVGRMDMNGDHLHVTPLPISGKGKGREFSLPGICGQMYALSRVPQLLVGLEWPTTRPGEGAERSERFGRGKGYLHMGLECYKVPYELIAPNLWKGRLHLPGKSDPESGRKCREYFLRYYPNQAHLITGPRGGHLDGPCDALLIAHWLRIRTVEGMRSVITKFGPGSPEAMVMALTGGRKSKRTR